MSKYSITIIIAYFGKFPEWSALYFETLRHNDSIKFIFYTDCQRPDLDAPNVVFNIMRFEAYTTMVSEKLGIEFRPANPYKLCDLKLFTGVVHYEDIKGADYYGWADLDLVFGDIRSYYTDNVLKQYDVFSTHEHIISGHFAIFRNNSFNRHVFSLLGGWEKKILAEDNLGMDESIIREYRNYNINRRPFRGPKSQLRESIRGVRMYLVEQYTTPFVPIPWLDGSLNSDQPSTWYYKDGRITNDRDGDREFMYLHFMNFKSSKYRADGTRAPWEGKERICFANAEDMISGIRIDPDGFPRL